MVYTQIGRGYSKELFDPHWCYVLKHCGTKLIVIPVTSIKPDSSTPVAPYEYDIEEEGGIKGRMQSKTFLVFHQKLLTLRNKSVRMCLI